MPQDPVPPPSTTQPPADVASLLQENSKLRAELKAANDFHKEELNVLKDKINKLKKSNMDDKTANKTDKEKIDFEHDEVFETLVKQGAVEGLIDQSSDHRIQRCSFGEVIHDAPSNVVNFLLSDSKIGLWRRHTLLKFKLGKHQKKRLMLWQYYLGGGAVCVEVRVGKKEEDSKRGESTYETNFFARLFALIPTLAVCHQCQRPTN